jgi:hypothetical protein
MCHTTARAANYPKVGDNEHIIQLVVDNFEAEDNDTAAVFTASGLAVLWNIHYDIWLHGQYDHLHDTITPIAGTNKDVVLAALRAGMQSGLTIADFLKLLNTALEEPVSRDTLDDDVFF